MSHLTSRLRAHSASSLREERMRLMYPYKYSFRKTLAWKEGLPSLLSIVLVNPSFCKSHLSTKASIIRTGLSPEIISSNEIKAVCNLLVSAIKCIITTPHSTVRCCFTAVLYYFYPDMVFSQSDVMGNYSQWKEYCNRKIYLSSAAIPIAIEMTCTG